MGYATSSNYNRINFGRKSVQHETIGRGLSNTFLDVIRQQINDSNYEMVNVLSSQIIVVLNPLVQTTIESLWKLVEQMA